MNKYSVKAAACALVGTLSLSGYQTTLEAKIHGSSDVPAAGVAVVMDEGSTIQDLQVEVVQNIAYLESASGLQPNIVLASEKAGLAEAVNHIVQSNPKLATAKATSENGQHSTTATDEEMSGQQETSNEEIFEQESQEQASSPLEESEVTSEQETSNSETFEQESSTEESSEQETSNQILLNRNFLQKNLQSRRHLIQILLNRNLLQKNLQSRRQARKKPQRSQQVRKMISRQVQVFLPQILMIMSRSVRRRRQRHGQTSRIFLGL